MASHVLLVDTDMEMQAFFARCMDQMEPASVRESFRQEYATLCQRQWKVLHAVLVDIQLANEEMREAMRIMKIDLDGVPKAAHAIQAAYREALRVIAATSDADAPPA
jgi:G:T/U-mismatch repair DNA glycosylase